jgi:hypothetical protein
LKMCATLETWWRIMDYGGSQALSNVLSKCLVCE